ncbi:MAG: hypothetical protein JNJ54_06285 [Myxococcaceae bacterium]|nr:hypothetical protein [Myxococcaceae bacterium]
MRSLVLLVLLAMPSASAAPKPRAPLSQVLRGDALTSYEAARVDFKASHFQQALAGFLKAHRLSGDPRLLWNAAACLRKLERNAEALRTIDRYLADDRDLSTEERDEALRTQGAVRALVAVVRLDLVPGDLAVSLDGTPLAAPWVLYVEPGRHAFHFSKPGFQDQLKQEALRAGEDVSWTVELAPLVAVPDVAPVAAAPPVPPVEVLKPLPAPAPARWPPWVVVGGGAVAGLIGGILLGASSADFARLQQQCGTMCSPQRWAGSRDREVAGVLLVAAGAATALAGLTWWFLSGGTAARVTLAPAHLSFEVRY